MTNKMATETTTSANKGTGKKSANTDKRRTQAAGGRGSVAASTKPVNGRSRVVIEGVTPQIDGARFAVKRVVGDQIRVEADVFGDGHDLVRAHLLHRHLSEAEWQAEEMTVAGQRPLDSEFSVGPAGLL